MKSQKLTQEIKNALRKWSSEFNLNQVKIAEKLEISNQAVNQWFNGEAKSIRPKNWQKLYPHLEKYLDDETKENTILVEDSPNNLTVPLVKIFDQLTKESATEVYKLADSLLAEENTNYFPKLTGEEIAKFEQLGIKLDSVYDPTVTLSPQGLCWLFNMMTYGKKDGEYLTPLLLRNLAGIYLDPEHARELYIKLFPIEAYDGSSRYWQYTFYLNGSPPKWYVPEFAPNGHGEIFEVSPETKWPFKPHKNTIVKVKFTEKEFKSLEKGETLKINFPVK